MIKIMKKMILNNLKEKEDFLLGKKKNNVGIMFIYKA